MENESVAKDKFRREFSGFAYEEKGKLKYFSDAHVVNVWEKRQELQLKGIATTPIIRKEYWLKIVGQLAKTKTEFMEYLKHYVDAAYMEKVKQLMAVNTSKTIVEN